MSLTGNSHAMVTCGSRAPPLPNLPGRLPAFLNLHGRIFNKVFFSKLISLCMSDVDTVN